MIVIDGQIAGSWRRNEVKAEVVIEAVLFAPLSDARQQALAKAVRRYSAFVGKNVRLVNERS